MPPFSLPETLAREIISSHQQRPRHAGPQIGAPSAERRNASCGDQITVWASLEEGRLRLSFVGQGCAVSQASASLMCASLSGKSLGEARVLSAQFEAVVLGQAAPSAELGDLAALSGVSRLLTRRRCALLAWQALGGALTSLGIPSGPDTPRDEL